MQRRKLDNGHTIAWEKSPQGDGLIFYAEGGPGGLVQIVDFEMTPPQWVAAALGIYMNRPLPAPPEPKPHYDHFGWR